MELNVQKGLGNLYAKRSWCINALELLDKHLKDLQAMISSLQSTNLSPELISHFKNAENKTKQNISTIRNKAKELNRQLYQSEHPLEKKVEVPC